VPKDKISIVGSFYYAMDGLTVFTQAVYFGAITPYYKYYFYFQVALAFVLGISAFFLFVESPVEMLFLGKKDEAVDSLYKVARINGIK
jgi:hypothetical protein